MNHERRTTQRCTTRHTYSGRKDYNSKMDGNVYSTPTTHRVWCVSVKNKVQDVHKEVQDVFSKHNKLHNKLLRE